MTIKGSQRKIVHNTDLKMNGLYILETDTENCLWSYTTIIGHHNFPIFLISAQNARFFFLILLTYFLLFGQETDVSSCA